MAAKVTQMNWALCDRLVSVSHSNMTYLLHEPESAGIE
jgi:hypothetical protein